MHPKFELYCSYGDRVAVLNVSFFRTDGVCGLVRCKFKWLFKDIFIMLVMKFLCANLYGHSNFFYSGIGR
jgi:hypothetical protein